MRKVIVLGLMLISTMQHVMAYKEPTHELMAEIALKRSLIGTDSSVLETTGLWSLEKQYFPDSKGQLRSGLDLVRFGAENEDSILSHFFPFPPFRFDCRCFRHFYDPVRERGLTIAGITAISSPDWALQDNDEVPDSKQEFSYRDARGYYRRALSFMVESARGS